MPGSLNNINVVESLSIVEKIAEGKFRPPCEFCIGGVRRKKPYWFVDGIYPKASFFISSISEPITGKQKLFASV